ncbi:hypothetical protein [Nocardioides sp. SYSU D00038]|uniref:hypothetical protein n=1 Tax=Nocardioides sp. SYSU D00038 TaxID=2812554 RepID=UPI0019686947|nr:hypothetical protein [Nocardioides sp. SYSU D00038]
MGEPGRRVKGGARRGARPRRSFRPDVALLALGAVVALAAWAGLVWLAIGFGRDARGGDDGRWLWLAGTGLVAAGALLACLLLTARALRAIGVLAQPDKPRADPPEDVSRGRRAA